MRAINIFLKHAMMVLMVVIPLGALYLVAMSAEIGFQGGIFGIFSAVITFLLLVMIFSIVSPLVEIAENTRTLTEALKADSLRVTLDPNPTGIPPLTSSNLGATTKNLSEYASNVKGSIDWSEVYEKPNLRTQEI